MTASARVAGEVRTLPMRTIDVAMLRRPVPRVVAVVAGAEPTRSVRAERSATPSLAKGSAKSKGRATVVSDSGSGPFDSALPDGRPFDTLRVRANGTLARTPGSGSGSGSGPGSGSGSETGSGSGSGSGTGSGTGTRYLALASTPAPLVPPSRFSLARPARLIWPVRRGDEDEGTLFVAQVHVDRDGMVVGARLALGPPRRHQDEAVSAVWRFRYEPALDDDGRPVASWVKQSFIVRR